MSTARLLVIEPDESDPLGPLGEWLTEAGAELVVRRPATEPLPESTDGYRGLICLGGGMDADDDRGYPWLASVRRLLGRAAGNAVPTLGVCLGAQLLTLATGGRTGRAEQGPEVGPSLVSKKDVAFADPLFGELPLLLDVMHFHQDVIHALPSGAELLASSPGYPTQAFRMNRCVYGIQFHIETTPEVVLDWAKSSPGLAAAARPGALSAERLQDVHADLAETWRPFAHRFVRLALGELEPAAAPPRSLPLA